MVRSRRLLPSLAAVVASCGASCGLWALAARAAQAKERTAGLEYLVPEGCPPSLEFSALVARRTTGRWLVLAGAGEPSFVVEIFDGPGGRTGRLRRTSHGVSTAREMTAGDCADLVRALALTAALSLEEEDLRVPAPSPAPPVERRRVLGVETNAAAIVGPSLLWGAALFVESRRGDWPRGPAAGRPDLTLAVAYARNDLAGEPAQARFALATAALAVCPLAWSVVRACGDLQAGLLDGRGVDVAMPASDRSLWAAAGASLRAEGQIRDGVSVGLRAGAAAPLRRSAFVFDAPRTPVATVPPVVFDVGVDVGVSIP